MQRESNVSVNDYYHILFYYVWQAEKSSEGDRFVNCETSYTCHPLRGSIEQATAILKELVCVCSEGRISMDKKDKKLCGFILKHFPVLNSTDYFGIQMISLIRS